MLRPLFVAAFVLALLPGPALAGPPALDATIDRIPVLPRAVVVPRSAGTSALERHRSAAAPAKLRAGQDMVLVVEVPDLSSPDIVAVTRAERHGRRVVVSLQRRRYTGPLAANVVTDAYVEVALGRLGRGHHQIVVVETVADFDDLAHPERLTHRKRGLSSTIELSIP